MAKKIKILETKLEQFVGEGFVAEDLKVVTKEIELDSSFGSRNYSNNLEHNVKNVAGSDSSQNKKEVLSQNNKIFFLPCEGTGAEAMDQVKRIINWMNKARYISFDVAESLDEKICDDRHSCTITGQTFNEALNSFALCLRHSFELLEDAYLLETAFQQVLESGLRTDDIMQPGMTLVSCEQMGTAVITELKLIEQGFCLE